VGFFDSFVLTLFDTSMTLLLVHSIKKSLKPKLLNLLIYIVADSIGIGFNIYIHNDVASHLFCTLVSIVALYLYFASYGVKNLTSSILNYFAISLILIVLQLAGVIFLNIVFGTADYTFRNGIISQVISLVLVFIIARFIPFSFFDSFIEERSSIFSVIITATFFLYYGITILWYIDVSNINNVILIIIVVLLFAIVINTVILREGFVSRIYKEKLSIYDTYFPIIDDMIEEIRGKQHDYHNQIQTILAMKKDELFTDKDIEDYIIEMNSNNIWKDLLKLDNKVISAFLYSKIIEGKGKCIHINLSIHDFNLPTAYSPNQLVEMYGILIDNAIEAVEAMNLDKAIELYIYREDERNVFEVRNPYKYLSVAEINNFFNNGYTTKNNEPRGIGLYKLKKMVESKKGTIDFYYDTFLGNVVAKIHHY